MGKYFGTDGFRGEANIDLTVEHAYKVGRFLGWYFGKDHKAQIVIGKDTRRSSYMFEYSLVAGLTASGADAYLLHVTTTPSVSYVVRTENFDCGIMISASHNPFYDNGIKVINGLGQKLEADIEAQIEAYIDDGTPKIPFATREDIGRTVDFAAAAMDIRTKDANIGHEAQIGSISDEAVFYLMSRGMTEEDARACIVSGFADDVSKELPLEYAVEMNNLIRLEMKGSIG